MERHAPRIKIRLLREKGAGVLSQKKARLQPEMEISSTSSRAVCLAARIQALYESPRSITGRRYNTSNTSAKVHNKKYQHCVDNNN